MERHVCAERQHKHAYEYYMNNLVIINAQLIINIVRNHAVAIIVIIIISIIIILNIRLIHGLEYS